jgi:type I protein arginine methyltransferase
MEFTPSTEPGFCNNFSWDGLSAHHIHPDKYFQGYGHFAIHEEMIKDKIRTRAYKNAILSNKYLFTDKIVLDVGCGTGILSFFALRAGARHVYAIDSADIIDLAIEISAKNAIQNITFIKGKVEDIKLPINYVDIIISEWMGYMLLYENMLETVIYARDKWLIPGGMMFPNKAKIYLAGIEDGKYKDEKIEFWNDVYGIDMSVLSKISLTEPLIEEISSDAILSTTCPVFEADLETVTEDELKFVTSYSIQFTRKDFMHGLVGWFDVIFTHCHKPVTLSTSPRSKVTHWKHTIFYLNTSQPVDVGQILTGSIALRQNLTNRRELDFKISFNISGPYALKTCQFYRLTR